MIRLNVRVEYSYDECDCERKNYKKYGEKHKGTCECEAYYWSNDKWFDDIPPTEYTLSIWEDRTEAIFDTKTETYTNEYMEHGTYHETIFNNPTKSTFDLVDLIYDFNDYHLGGMEICDIEYDRDIQFEIIENRNKNIIDLL